MNIYGHTKNATQELRHIFNNDNKKDINSILLAIKSSWRFIHKYIKNIHPEWTIEFSTKLNIINPEELVITSNMISNARRSFISMEQEREIKTYMMYFIWIMNKLLIFNKSDEEGCRVCQGELYYYFDIEHDILIKECGTCSSWYHGKSDNTIKEFTKNIRPATRTDLIDNKISWNA